MTKKSKARKAQSAAKASAPKPAPEAGEPKMEESEIRTLVSRWRWLEADQEYQADCAATEEEGERLIAIHNDEQNKIECQLATLDPKSMMDVSRLLGFVLKFSDGCVMEEPEIAMLKNIKSSLPGLWRDEIDKARKESVAKTKAQMRESYRLAIDTFERIDARTAEREAA